MATAARSTASRPTSTIDGLDDPFHGVFIRAPRVEPSAPASRCWPATTTIPVLVRHGHVMAASFHPELTNDTRLHELFVSLST